MPLTLLQPRKALNPAYLKLRPNRSEIETFKRELVAVLNGVNEAETEEHHKTLLAQLLRKVWYEPAHYINTKGRADLVIHTGPDAKSPVGVLLEVKRPGKGNAFEMLRPVPS